MSHFRANLTLVALLVWGAIFHYGPLCAQPISVHQQQGQVHGFLVLLSLNGEILANGDSIQQVHGGQVTNRLTFHFKDGSMQDETVVFAQSGNFRVLSDHLVQRGPTFKNSMDLMIDAKTGKVTVKYTNAKGESKVETKTMKLPPDLANGIVPVVLQNLAPGTQSATESMVVATPKPMLIKLAINAEGEDSFSTGSAAHKSTRYKIHVDIGGIKGVIAPVLGKEPPDTRVWISQGDCPAFVKSQGPRFRAVRCGSRNW
jgi:hypothetical protein